MTRNASIIIGYVSSMHHLSQQLSCTHMHNVCKAEDAVVAILFYYIIARTIIVYP